jgi:MYXO-CTERM domain-containing protein
MAQDTGDVRADIAQTRGEMADTANALAEELDPRVRARRAAGAAGAQLRTRAEAVTRTLREDPRRAAGLGAAVLVVLGARRRRRR